MKWGQTKEEDRLWIQRQIAKLIHSFNPTNSNMGSRVYVKTQVRLGHVVVLIC